MPTVRLRIVCELTPPAIRNGKPTEFGLQDKNRALTAGDLLSDETVSFEFEARAEQLAASTDTKFSGTFVHGSPSERFLYLGWRPVGGAIDDWIRRWKISLAGIPFEQIEALGSDEGLEIRLRPDEARMVWPRGDGWKRYSAARA